MRRLPSGVIGLLIALAAVAAATGLTYVLLHSLGPHPAIGFAYLFAIMAAAWWGGYAPGIAVCLISTFLVPYLFNPRFSAAKADISRLLLILLVSVLVSWIAASRRKIEAVLRAANESLDERVRQRTTELERANEALRESEARLAIAMEAGGMGDWDWDLAAGRIAWSPQIEAIHGLSAGAFGGTVEEFQRDIHPDHRARVMNDIECAIAGKGNYRNDYPIRKPDGEEAWIEARGRVILNDRGEAVRMIGVCLDVTHRKQVEEELVRQAAELARSNADLDQFAAAASHDLQEPLRIIASYSQLIARHYGEDTDPDIQQFVHYMTQAVQRMRSLILDLLEYSRAGAQPDAHPLDTHGLVSDVIAGLQESIATAGATIQQDRLPPIVADEAGFHQVMQNLVSNALKYRHPDRTPLIHISGAEDSESWSIAVRDNGIGIQEEYRERIFKMFHRLHGQEVPGTGIGLAIVKRVLDGHRGSVQLESTPGLGSTFIVTIPKRPACD